MPCSDGLTSNYWFNQGLDRNRQEVKDLIKIVDDLQHRNDVLTRLLCGVMTELEAQNIDSAISTKVDGLPTWWKQHKKLDEKRKLLEK